MSNSPAAIRWCTYGAMEKVYDNKRQLHSISDKLEDSIRPWSIPSWNDMSTHAEVLNKLKELDI